MAFGTLKADTLTHSTAGSLATNFVVEGSAKSWCKWNASVTVDDSFNQSSMVDVGTGDYEVVFTTSFGAASKFAAAGIGGQYGSTNGYMSWTGGGNNNTHADRIKVQLVNASGSAVDADKNAIIVHGDLA
tara:strand:+ start:440 stop:829 length:390 start_codon:yes stop_codon:yes gene_type:complete